MYVYLERQGCPLLIQNFDSRRTFFLDERLTKMTENDNRIGSENIRDQHHLHFWTESLSVTVSQDEGHITPKGMFGFNIHLDKARSTYNIGDSQWQSTDFVKGFLES
jgi:hypothetical protein